MLVASLLLVVGVAAALGAMAAATREMGYANELQTATVLGQQQLAQVEANYSLPSQTTQSGGMSANSQQQQISAGQDSGTFDPPFSMYRWDQTIQATLYPTLFEVDLKVTWQSGNLERSKTFSTYLTQPPTLPQTGTGTGTGGTG